ncbi:AMP-binding protein [Sphingomonas melonis TY]|jgi:acyl-CoA ligase (AMP-forming) (exosortase A-associated)|nr:MULTISPECIES: acyl-CoA ligase (AMP-forming), exosortase A system-associated [Sphingomonas]AOW25071.1 acyl-CoA ligase (AMP-forming), exosortase A system-associated [Sphingomonas melonis TY]ATI57148.1 acyl-CoA ligase (AMP-forming), exosortase A system-associated [Sphingomonas melonis]KZB94715.1 AMP-binding protein [Sphingomonas melonis TY]MBI0531862.1 acyl-CoA ligase (AMP-forming), exosortase A system-associated [Sphingomonas sp. TX0522]MBX8845009.1 acyl-CoA ligase (AMP-forming), exosortase A
MAPDPTPFPIDHLLRGDPDAPALIERARTWRFAEVEAAVASVAGWLAASGFAPGARVATWLPKTALACVMPLAVARAGLVHVPVNPALRRAQVAHILADSSAALLVTQASRAATLEAGDRPADCRLVEADAVPMADAGPGRSDRDPASLAAILYTSGSTGRPKGVMLSHANLWLGAVSVAHYLRLSPADRVLGVLPLSFDYGQNQLLSSWYAGAAVAPLDYLIARDVVKAVERTQATTLAGVPPLWVQLLEADWPAETAARLRRLTNSGGALTERLVRGLRSRFPQADLVAMYGLTEAFRSTWLDPALIDTHPDAMGRAIPFAEVAVVKADGTRAVGEPGELVHAGPLVAQGYWRDAERTAQRFRPTPAWMASGGMAVWSGDTVLEGADGLLRFVGRDDEMIKSAGNRISPLEVEEAVLAGGEAREAVAVGVPDPRSGQAIVVVLAGDPAGEDALRARLRGLLPSFMQPARYDWREELPRNANGKLDRAAIRAETRA